ncbi:myb-like protein X [Leptopilina heterotoma]|uniref:myb-like protein X n=1 Tax=Leptopilina heterotoma TaxID=63436 RepID=UPI001CA9E027|nr:myb-like protein X [Leptopilina heterotoma]
MQIFKEMKRPFHIKADEEDYKKYSTLIETNGGRISKKLTFSSFTITSEKYRNYTKDTFKLKYVTDCIKKQELLNYYLYSWSINYREYCGKCLFFYKSYTCLGPCDDYKVNSLEKFAKTASEANNLQLIPPPINSPQPSTSKQNVFQEDERGKGANNERREEIKESAKKKKQNISIERGNFSKIVSDFPKDERKRRAANTSREEEITESVKKKKQKITNEGDNFSKLTADSREIERGEENIERRGEITGSAKKKKQNITNEGDNFSKLTADSQEIERGEENIERRGEITGSAKKKKQNITNEGDNFSKLTADSREIERGEENIERRGEITESAKKKKQNITSEGDNFSKLTADSREIERGEENIERRGEITESAKKKKQNITNERETKIDTTPRKKKQINYKIEKCYLNISSNGLISLRDNVTEKIGNLSTKSNQELENHSPEERLKLKEPTEQKIQEQLKFYNIKPCWILLERLKIHQKMKHAKKGISTFNESETGSELINESNSENTPIQQISSLDGSKTDLEFGIFENQLKITIDKPIEQKKRMYKKTLKRIKMLERLKGKKTILPSDNSNSDLESKTKKSISPPKIQEENTKKRNIGPTESETESDIEIAVNKSIISKNRKNRKKLRSRTNHISSDSETESDGNSAKKQILSKDNNTNAEIVSSKLNNYGELKISKTKLKPSSEKQVFKINIDIEKVLSESSNSETGNKSKTTSELDNSKERILEEKNQISTDENSETRSEKITEKEIDDRRGKISLSIEESDSEKRKIKSKKRLIVEESNSEEELINLPIKDISIPIERCDSVNFFAQETNSKRRKIDETNNNNKDDCDTTMEIQIENNSRHKDNISDDSDIEKIDKIFTQGTIIDSDHDLFGNTTSGDDSTVLAEREIVDSFDSLEVQLSSTTNNLKERNLNKNDNSEENEIDSREFLQNNLKENEVDLLDSDDREALLDDDSETEYEDDDNLNSSIIEVEVKKEPVKITLITLDDVQNNEENYSDVKEENEDSDIEIIDDQETPEICKVRNPVAKIEKESQIKMNLNEEKNSRTLENSSLNLSENLDPSRSLIIKITKHSQHLSSNDEQSMIVQTKENLIQIEKESQHYSLNDESIEREENESMEKSTSNLEKSSELSNSGQRVNNTEDDEDESTIDSQRQIFTQFDRKARRKVQFAANQQIISNEQEISSNEPEIDSNNSEKIQEIQREIKQSQSGENNLEINLQMDRENHMSQETNQEMNREENPEMTRVFETNPEIHSNDQEKIHEIKKSQSENNREINLQMDREINRKVSQETLEMNREENRETNRESNEKMSQDSNRETNQEMSQEINRRMSQETNLEMEEENRETNRETKQKINQDNHKINGTFNGNKEEIDGKIDSQNDNRKIIEKKVEDDIDSDCSRETIIYESINKNVIEQKEEKTDDWSEFLADDENNSHNDNKNDDDDDNEKENSIKINFKTEEQKLLPKKVSYWEDWNSSDSS